MASTASNSAWWTRREAAVPRGVGSMHPRFCDRAEGAHLFDADGRRYLDFATGIAVCNTGHGHPRILEAVRGQIERFSHVSFQVTPYDSYVEFAERLNAAAPGASAKKSIFLTTGAEAIENAVKIARVATGRRGVITFRGGYHGRTLLTLAMTGKVLPYKAGFGPMPSEIFHALYPLPYLGISEADALASIEQVFAADIEPQAVAAIVIEPVLGEGGFYAAPPSFLRALRALCDRHGILLIVDEIQSGFARTGRMFAIEAAGIEPDLMTVAKAMAGGFPLSGVIGKAEIMDAVGPGGLGGTYGGSPLGCAAGLAVLDVIAEEGLIERAAVIGGIIHDRMTALRDGGVRALGDIRGPGAMVAIELVKDGDAAQPDPELTRTLVQEAAEQGLILLSCGIRGNVVRFLPALIMRDEQVHEAMDIVEGILKSRAF